MDRSTPEGKARLEERVTVLQDFVIRFVEETGYGVDESWIKLNLPIGDTYLRPLLRKMIADNLLRITKDESNERLVYYWPVTPVAE